MAGGSSGKKVAKAARAGGSRARTAGERSILFPASLAIVVILGTLLVVVARNDRQAVALEPPIPGEDHWHAAYGFYVCDSYLPQIGEFEAATGIHTHGDGVIHIHPFSGAGGGDNATLGTFLDIAPDAGIGNDSFEAFGEKYESGFECDGEPAEIRVLRWDVASTAADTEPTVITEDLDGIRFLADGEAYAIVAAAADADVPPPPTSANLAELGVVDGGGNDRDANATTIPEAEDIIEDVEGLPDDPGATEGDSPEGDATEGDSTEGDEPAGGGSGEDTGS